MSNLSKKTNLERFLERGAKHSQLKKFKPGSLRTNSQLKKPFEKPRRKGETHYAGSNKKKGAGLQANFKNGKLKKLLIETNFDPEQKEEEEDDNEEQNSPLLNPLNYKQNISFANNQISNETNIQGDYNIYKNSQK